MEGFLSELRRDVDDLMRARTVTLPRVTTDPASPEEGQVWVNTLFNQLKVRYNGVTHVVNLT